MLAVISHPDCLRHETGDGHPESAERLEAINNQLIMSGLDFVISHRDAPEASRADLERVHDAAYVDEILSSAPETGLKRIDGDTAIGPHSVKAALRAAGAGICGVDLIMSGEANPVFCAVRPPGHHAERARAMGFCLFDNVAVAAAYALDRYALSRVAVVDFDVHHGNGTEDIFRNDSRVLFCSSFQHPFYPFTGHASDAENLVAVPLANGSDGNAFRQGIEEHWLPALDRFRPEFLFISAGFDAHVLDDMSGLALTEADYAWVTERLAGVANRHAGGRILSMLEGGYHPGALGRSVAAHIKVLIG